MCQANHVRISEVENKIGAGLIEEVIQVAEGELELVDVMSKAEVYVLTSSLQEDTNSRQMGRLRGEASRGAVVIFHA